MPATATTQRQGTFQSLGHIVPYMRPKLGFFVLGLLTALASSIVSLLIPAFMRRLVDGPLQDGDPSQVWPIGLIILALGLAEAAFHYLRRFFVAGPGTEIEAIMRMDLYTKLQRLPVSFHDRWESGQLLSRAVQDLGRLRRFMLFGIIMSVVNLLTILVGVTMMLTWSWQLTLVFLVINLPLVFATLVFERKYFALTRLSQDQTGDLATTVEQSVHGIRVLKALGRGPYALDGFTDQASELRGTEMRKARLDGFLWGVLRLVPLVSYAVCLFVGVSLVAEGQLTVGQLVAFFGTTVVLTWPIESIGFLVAMAADSGSSAQRFHEVMTAEESIQSPAEPTSIAEPQGRLEFRDVHFRYQDAPEGERDLVDGASLVIEPGETMALIGVTGSGKSTLIALPARLYDVTAGQVLLDGVDVRDLPLPELRQHITMAFEDPTLFSRSVRENVLLGDRGRPDFETNPLPQPEEDALLEHGLSVAQAQFAQELPDGVETQIGEEGLSLSGGQRQRLALARAVAAGASVMVLDDPLSALDVETEAQVEAALRTVLATTTALIVAHRPSTVQLADRVALMQDGKIVAVGPHAELLATNEHYRYVISSLEDEERNRQVMP